MTNNLHPLFVHFPIALFSIYVLLELMPSKKLRQNRAVFDIKCFLLLIGVISGFPSLASGESVENMFGRNTPESRLVEAHSFWAALSVGIFAALCVLYLIEWFEMNEALPLVQKIKPWLKPLKTIQRVFHKTPLLVGLALLGFLSLTVAGSLGAALVHGPEVDPIVSWMVKMNQPLIDAGWF